MCLQWEPSAELTDPKDANLIDVEHDPYLSRPQEFEPGYGQPPDAQNPHACAPPPTDSVLNFGFPGVYWRVTSLQPPSEACVPCCVPLPLSLWLCLTLARSLSLWLCVCLCVCVSVCLCVCAVPCCAQLSLAPRVEQ